MVKIYRTLVLFLLIICMHSVSAGTLRFDFSGFTFDQASSSDPRVFTGVYNEYFLIDESVEDTASNFFFSRFENSIIDGQVTINEVAYSLQEGGLNRTGVTNNAGAEHDGFYVNADVLGDNGESGLFGLALIDLSDQFFDSTEMPSNLTHEDFDYLDNFFRGSIAVMIFSSSGETMTVEYAHLRPVPLPGSLLMLGSALLGSLFLRTV